jgi:hypothetical protein
MKKICFFLLFFAFGLGLNAQLSSGLVAHYPFTGNANDATDNNHDATFNTGILTTDRFGNANSAYAFNGSNWIEVPHAEDLDLYGDKTISAWAFVPSGLNLPFYPTILAKNDPIGYYPTFNIQLLEYEGYESNRHKYSFFWGNDANNYLCNSEKLYTNYFDQWVHIAGTYSKENGITKIYINGSLSDSLKTDPIASNSNTGNLVIGRDLSTQKSFFNGKIDDIRIYNRTLNKSEITGLYMENVCFQNITVTDTLVINANLTGFNPISYSNTIKIFPNPANDKINIDFGSNYEAMNNYTLKITNSISQVVFSTKVNKQKNIIALNTWSGNGIYFVHVIDENNNTIDIKKIVLQ